MYALGNSKVLLRYTQKHREKSISCQDATPAKGFDLKNKPFLGFGSFVATWCCYDQARIDPRLTSMAKMNTGKTAVEVTDEAGQILGGYGCLAEYDVERFYRDAKIMEIYEGTKEIQKNTIASALIGKGK